MVDTLIIIFIATRWPGLPYYNMVNMDRIKMPKNIYIIIYLYNSYNIFVLTLKTNENNF